MLCVDDRTPSVKTLGYFQSEGALDIRATERAIHLTVTVSTLGAETQTSNQATLRESWRRAAPGWESAWAWGWATAE